MAVATLELDVSVLQERQGLGFNSRTGSIRVHGLGGM
jgi:hypothetical protein